MKPMRRLKRAVSFHKVSHHQFNKDIFKCKWVDKGDQIQFHILDLMTNVSFSKIDKSASGLYSLAVVNSSGEVWHYFKITIEGEQLSNWEQPVGNHERMEICRYHGTYIEKETSECDFEPSPPTFLSGPEEVCSAKEGETIVAQVTLFDSS